MHESFLQPLLGSVRGSPSAEGIAAELCWALPPVWWVGGRRPISVAWPGGRSSSTHVSTSILPPGQPGCRRMAVVQLVSFSGAADGPCFVNFSATPLAQLPLTNAGDGARPESVRRDCAAAEQRVSTQRSCWLRPLMQFIGVF